MCGEGNLALYKSVLFFHRHFDAHGNYYLKKDPESIQDNWLEGFDWSRVCVCVCVWGGGGGGG